MAVYAVGDIQGCALPLEALLDELQFDPAVDQLWLTGDLVNRGPHSLRSLRLVRSLGTSAITVLGNHDLHLLAVAEGIKRNRKGDTLKAILKAPDRDELIQWLRHQPLAYCDKALKTIMVHAGVYPGWSRKKLMKRAREVEAILQGPDYQTFLKQMYGKKPSKWQGELQGWERARFITNTLTRMRFCDKKGNLNFVRKGPPGSQPKRYIPWYDHPEMKCKGWQIVFGHWSALGFRAAGNVISLDSGCVWGGRLTAVRLDRENGRQYWQIDC